MDEQQYIMQMQIMEQEANQLDQQIQAIDQQVSELTSVKESLEALETSKKNKNMLANLGKGIFVETEIKSNELLVNVGKNILIKKTPEQAIKIIDEQMAKLSEGRGQILERIEELQVNMQNLLLDAQKHAGVGKHAHNHSCENDNCECEEPCDDCKCKHEH